MKHKKTDNRIHEKNNNDLAEDFSDEHFAYEVKSTNAENEFLEKLSKEIHVEAKKEEPIKKTIKIVSEKNLEIIEIPPPNFSPLFICVLHFKNQVYTQRKLLENSL